MSTIVVGYDGTEGADIALCEAAALARELGDRLVLVFSYEINRLGGEVADYADALRQYGRGILERGRSSDVLAGLDVELREVGAGPGARADRDRRRVRRADDRHRLLRRAPAQGRPGRLDAVPAACTSASGRSWSCAPAVRTARRARRSGRA